MVRFSAVFGIDKFEFYFGVLVAESNFWPGETVRVRTKFKNRFGRAITISYMGIREEGLNVVEKGFGHWCRAD